MLANAHVPYFNFCQEKISWNTPELLISIVFCPLLKELRNIEYHAMDYSVSSLLKFLNIL